jgi:hypothetical protein
MTVANGQGFEMQDNFLARHLQTAAMLAKDHPHLEARQKFPDIANKDQLLN